MVGGLIPGHESVSLLDGKLARWSKAPHAFQKEKKKKKI
jgi:hypothetical protein